MSGFQLRRLRITGPDCEPAEIAFKAGLNVVSGASDTGKSYLVEAIDFMLGGATPPRTIPEAQGYDTAHLLLEAHDGQQHELTRALQGGDFQLATVSASGDDSVKLGSRHAAGTSDNVSAFLLRLVGLDGKRVRKNALNELQNLSFRNLAHLVVVDEESIIKKGSPVHGGESTQRTAQGSVFKLLLTGQDDSALIAAKKPAIARAELEAKLTLLDQLIVQYAGELNELTDSPNELDGQLQRISRSVERSAAVVETERTAFEQQERAREEAWRTQDECRSRYSEIVAHMERFALLDEHYRSDLNRLEAVAEAGYFFVALDVGRCPLCGAPAGDHHHDDEDIDGDVDATRRACEQEIAKIHQLRSELAVTVRDLAGEQERLRERFTQARAAYQAADALVRGTLAPSLSMARSEHSALMEKRAEIRQALSLRDRITDLREKRSDVEAALAQAGHLNHERPGLPPAAVQMFSTKFELLLDAWRFPYEKPVYFDERSQDFVLGSRRRGEQGKGLRALTHAAFTIGLQRTCRALRKPTVGFVLLDSPLVTFREADAIEAGLDVPARLAVKQAFYRDLQTEIVDQIIIVENEDPDSELQEHITSYVFTKRADIGRAGFFPLSSASA